ncbi:helix-turn-helix domain-containing protein [Peribacillus frigoritolerans]|uniref:helix-turn-helix domain-containing protein n=1 Tax=Peribacillus frigoritolerans TaxID=450367 RepID=UPI001F4F2F72|nr:helix-turn-helix domain-containing protein [Peribacillus frigoritolerans]MCK2017948.1 helix-turn-helix domain-containing protein [Peribacillus frigoritolerans]
MKVNSKFNITMPNVAFAWGTQYHMTEGEFMLYAHLQFMRQGSQWNQTFTSVDMIIHYLGLGTKNKQRDKAKVIENLNSLVEKGYITIDCEGDMKKVYFTVKQVQEILSTNFVVEFEENGKNRKFMGFTKLSGEHYNLANNEGRALMTITYTNWRNNINYNVPKSEWVKVLGIAKSTLEDCFNDYKERFLNVFEGNHYQNEQGQIRQETNSHVIADKKKQPIKLEDKEKKVKAESFLDKLRSQVTDLTVMRDDNIFMQIFDKNTFIEFKGYKAWKETTCPFVKVNGQKKIDAMKASENKIAGEVADKLEREYQEYLLNQKQQREMIDKQIARYEDDMYVPEEFLSSYVKKEKPSIDITYYLED